MRQTQVSVMRGLFCTDMQIAMIRETARLRLLRIASQMSSFNVDAIINERAEVARLLRDNSINGKAHIEVWQRDCDMAEWTTKTTIDANVRAYTKLRNEIAEGAEGPFRLHILTPREAASWTRESRDRVLEAFENGSYYNV